MTDTATRTILVVDDHESLRRSLRDWLQAECPTCRFIEAGSGEEAIDLVREHEPSLVVMDIGLPGITGIEATRRVKANYPSIPVIILSVYDGESYREDAHDAGASAYISKRRLQQDLIGAVSRHIVLERDHERVNES
jgi:DNA-binding NarL/FixJ family response regulator